MRLVCFLALAICCTFVAGETSRPIIGILSLPLEDTYPPIANIHRVRYPSGATAIIPASYVKWIEQSGARVAVVPYNSTMDELTSLWNGINGLLYTGGGLSLDANTTYFQAAKHLYDLTINANANGDNFAIWGTCQGFQLLNIMASNNHSILTCNFDSENLPLSLDFTEAASTSRLFSDSQSSVSQGVSVWDTLASRPATMNLHHCGIFPDYFYENPDLYNNYDMLSTNQDRKGASFVSTMEHKKFPIFAAQWHGERPQFEWDLIEQLDKSPYTMRAMQYASDIFVREARQNSHAFPSPSEEAAALIYNYTPFFTGNDPEQSFPDQLTYIWF